MATEEEVQDALEVFEAAIRDYAILLAQDGYTAQRIESYMIKVIETADIDGIVDRVTGLRQKVTEEWHPSKSLLIPPIALRGRRITLWVRALYGSLPIAAYQHSDSTTHRELLLQRQGRHMCGGRGRTRDTDTGSLRPV